MNARCAEGADVSVSGCSMATVSDACEVSLKLSKILQYSWHNFLGVLCFMCSVEVSELIDAPCRMFMRAITKNLQRLKFAFICQQGCPLPSRTAKHARM